MPKGTRSKTSNRTKIVIIFVALAVCLVVARIVYVNISTEEGIKIETEHYAMGEWVDLNGAFISIVDLENTQGYSVRVNDAEIVSYNEYIERYGQDKTQKIEGLEEPSVIDLELEVRNTDSESGGIYLFGYKLIPERKNTYYLFDDDLLVKNEPSMEGTRGFSVLRGRTYTLHIPYTINENDKENYSEYRTQINDARFELPVTHSPVKKIIDINL